METGSRLTADAKATVGHLVFISAKSDDYEYAAKVYQFLTDRGLRVFFSELSLPKLGNADYGDQIDEALEEAAHMVVVTSSRERVMSPWVRAEWRSFSNAKRGGRKAGNLLTVLAGQMKIDDLPQTLLDAEAVPLTEEGLERLLAFVKDPPVRISPRSSEPVEEAAASPPSRPASAPVPVEAFVAPPAKGAAITVAPPAEPGHGETVGSDDCAAAKITPEEFVEGGLEDEKQAHDRPQGALKAETDHRRLLDEFGTRRAQLWAATPKDALSVSCMALLPFLVIINCMVLTWINEVVMAPLPGHPPITKSIVLPLLGWAVSPAALYMSAIIAVAQTCLSSVIVQSRGYFRVYVTLVAVTSVAYEVFGAWIRSLLLGARAGAAFSEGPVAAILTVTAAVAPIAQMIVSVLFISKVFDPAMKMAGIAVRISLLWLYLQSRRWLLGAAADE